MGIESMQRKRKKKEICNTKRGGKRGSKEKQTRRWTPKKRNQSWRKQGKEEKINKKIHMYSKKVINCLDWEGFKYFSEMKGAMKVT